MALDYKSVLDIYDASREGGLTDKSLPDWSQEMNTKTGTELYSAGLHDNWIKRGSAKLDKLIEATGIPEYGAAIGRDVGSLVGDEAAGEQVGRGLGRMTVNVAPLLIPGVGWGATAARLGGTALLSGAETYTETGSPAAGLLSGATMAAMPGVANIAEQAALKRLGARQLADLAGVPLRYAGETTGQKVGAATAGQVAAAGLFGVSGAGQEVLAGETPSSPFTTANLLSLTLGQLPFAAAHLGGRAISEATGGKTAAMRADELTKALNLSEASMKLRAIKKEIDDRPPLKDQPDVEKPLAEAFTPEQYETARATRLILSRVRGDMIAVKKDTTLTDEQKVEQTNDLLNQEYAALRERETALATTDTIFGNRIEPDAPRTDLIGKQIRINKKGTWRAIEVADDPFNPEELRGKIIGYSAVGEPPVHYGVQTQQTGVARYSMPDRQWWTIKSKDEWNMRYKKDDNGQPVLPEVDEPMSHEELSAHLHEIENIKNQIDAAATTGDMQEAVTALNAVKADNDLTPTNDGTLKDSVGRLVNAGVKQDVAVKSAVTAEANRTKRKITAKQQSVLLEAGYEQADIDAMTMEQRKDALAAVREARRKRPAVREELQPTEEAVAEEEALSQRGKERAAAPLTAEEAATVAAQFGEDVDTMRGMSIVDASKVSHGKSEDLAVQEVSDMVTDAAVASINDPAVVEAYKTEPNKADYPLHKDTADFVDLVERFGSIKDVDLQEAADFLNSRTGTTDWDKGEMEAFLNRPHVKVMSNRLDMTLTNLRRTNEAPVPAMPVRIGAGEGFFFGLPTYEEFQNRLRGSIPKSGLVPVDLFQKKGGLRLDQPLAKGEMELYRQLVPEAFSGNAVHVEKLVNGLKERGPVVETKKIGVESDVTKQEEQRLIHELDTAGYSVYEDNGLILQDRTGADVDWIRNAPPENVERAFQRLREIAPTGPGETGTYSFVGPKSPEQMPGYVEGLVRLPDVAASAERSKIMRQLSLKAVNRYSIADSGESVRWEGPGEPTPEVQGLIDQFNVLPKSRQRPYVGPHFGAEDTNVLSFYRGYEETLPNGEKAFHVIEVQSDWGQSVRSNREQQREAQQRGEPRRERDDKLDRVDHPLLSVYNELTLKAAMQHAKDIGATKLIVSDAETAMMTEGHDRAAHLGQFDVVNRETGEVESSNLVEQDARRIALSNPAFEVRPRPVERPVIPQEKGMRLNYDQKLPGAMEKLTGEKGQVVDLGVHKMSDATQRAPGTPDGSLVFKNPDGTPKTNVTGRMYDISKAGPEFSLFGAREAPVAGAKPLTGRARHDAPPWVPTEQQDIATMRDMGLHGDGNTMLDFIMSSGHPILEALGRDLTKFGPALKRVLGGVYDIGSGAFVKYSPSGNFEIRLSPGILRMEPVEQAYTLAHELVHGLTLAELRNPTKAGYVEAFNNLRGRLIGAMPEKMRRAANDAINSDWYTKWSNRQVSFESLMPGGTNKERSILYSILNNDEMVAGGLTDPAVRRFMQSVKSEGRPWYSRFANLIKETLGIGEKVEGTAWEEFLSHTHGLLDRGSHIADFRNYSDRYFENLGQPDTFVRTNTQRATGLILSNLGKGHDIEDVLQRIRIGAGHIRSPEWQKAVGDAATMFAEKGDDFQVTRDALAEVGHLPDQMGLTDFADSVMLGKIPLEHLDVLPERAARLVFETAKDVANILGVVRGATLEGNRGVLNVANPDLIHNLSKKSLASVEKVLAQSKLHDMAVQDLQGLFAMPPDGFQDKMVSAPGEIPPEYLGESKKSWFDHVENFLSPATQIARSIPEAAEAFSRGRQLHANQRKMATEGLKAFGMDLETMDLSSESVKNTAKTFEQPRLTDAVNKWIHQNNVVGDRTGEVRVLDVEDPRVQDILSGLSAKDKDVVEDMVNKQSISTQFVQSEVLEKRLQIGTTDGAIIAQSAEGGKLRDAVARSEQLIRAFTADRTDPVAARAADAQIAEVQAKMSLEGFQKLAAFAETVAGGWKAQQELFQKNPAWASGQRHGKFLMEFVKGKKAQLRGVESRKEAEVIAEGRPFKLTPNRGEDVDRPPFMGFGSVDTINRLRDFDQQYIDHMRSSGAFTPDQIELMKRYSPAEHFTTEQVYRGGVKGIEPQPRRLTKGAEELPWLENHFAFINKTSNYWSRQLFRSQARAHLLDPEIKSNPDLHGKLENYYDNLLQPDTALGHFLTRSAVTWFMGYNPASAMVNATQPFMTHVAEFTRLTGRPFNSYKRVLGGLGEVIAHAKTGKWANEEHEWLIKRATQDGFVDNSMYDANAAANETVATRLKQILSRQRPQTTGQRLGTLAGSFSNVGMWMFRTVERMNNMSALLSSYDFYRESQPNLSRNELYEKVVQFNEAVNYGGGPAARPIGLYKAFPRTAAMLTTSMQSYNLGSMFQLARYLKQGFFRPEGLTPHEVYSARIAGVQMLATQLGAAGVLGLPLASGMLAILNTAFPGLELNRHFREGIATVMGGDEKNGNILGDIAMTGVPSMMGWDVQSRLSMGNSLPGVSEVNGFQPENLAGAPVNLISNFVKGGIKLVSGDPRGAEAFVPNALKKFEQLLRSGGQVLDYRDRPVFTPTLGEKVGIALGFNPKRLSDYNAAARMARQTDDNIKRREGQFHQNMAEQILKGNFGNVRQELQQKIRENKDYDPINAVRSIAGAAEELTFPRDLRREGPRAAADPRSKLLATFNLPATQPSETDRLKFRQSVEQRLGLPTTSATDLQLATVMDQLRRQQPLQPRAELRRQATLLVHGSRPRTLQEPLE